MFPRTVRHPNGAVAIVGQCGQVGGCQFSLHGAKRLDMIDIHLFDAAADSPFEHRPVVARIKTSE
ncbi:hypothetical protein QW131_07210 [Roseibium salinum]|nr:hypothetical protein [Roseibium salinum]